MSNNESSIGTIANMEYTVFKPNQLLTSKHLNDLRIYLDNQDRLSRTKLVGIGVACGLEVSTSNSQITISAGVGITSEGFLISMDNESYTHYRSDFYSDPKGYEMFKSDQDESPLEIWELVSEDDTSEIPKESFLSAGANFLNDKVVLLFVESKDVDLETCVGQNCDDKGTTRRFTVRKLLLRCSDVEGIIEKGYNLPYDHAANDTLDGSFNTRFYPDYAQLPAFNLIYDQHYHTTEKLVESYVSIDTEEELRNRYRIIFQNSDQNPLKKLVGYIQNAYSYYKPWLGDVNVDSLWEKVSDIYSEFYSKHNEIQYFYAFAKDVFKAYNEFIDVAFEITSECNLGHERFPKHLILGKVKNGGECSENECKPAIFRTHFIQSSIYNEQKDKIEKARTYFLRLINMFRALRVDLDVKEGIDLIPSNEKQALLGKRSIPYYYDVSELYPVWNYELTKRCKTLWNKGYWMRKIASAPQPTQDPLRFDLDALNFYRIEGLLGKNVWEVCHLLNELRSKFHLDFDIKTVKLKPLKKKLLTTVHKNGKCRCNDCCDDFIKDSYIQLRTEIIADVEKYNWVLTKLIYLLGNYQLMISEMHTGKKAMHSQTHDSDLMSKWNRLLKQIVPKVQHVQEAKKLIETLPLCIGEFNLKNFKNAFKDVQEMAFIVTLLFERLLRENPLLGPFIQYFIERFLFANFGYLGSIYDLNDIVRSNLEVRMQSLYHSYLLRLKAKDESRVFSKFAYQNPGLEPMAGVPKGGTLVMVYKEDLTSENKGQEDIIADFALTSKVSCGISVGVCGKNRDGYAPIAKNVYHLIDRKVNNEPTAVKIDVLEFSLDLNVENIDIVDFEQDDSAAEKLMKKESMSRSTKKGGVINIDDDSLLNRKVIYYTPPSNFDGGLDKFDYKIINSKTKKVAKGTVFVGILPNGQNLQVSEVAQQDKFRETSSPKNESPKLDTDYNPKWAVTMEDFGKVKTLEGMIGDRDNSVKGVVDRTKNRYRVIRDLDPLTDNSTPEEKVKREKIIAETLHESLEETSDLIKLYDKSLPKEDEMYTLEGMRMYNENRDMVSKRDTATALYENLVTVSAELAVSEGYLKSENSEMSKMFNKVGVQMGKMNKNAIGSMRNLQNIAKMDSVDDQTKSILIKPITGI